MYYVFPAHSASIAIGFDASDQDIVPEHTLNSTALLIYW